MTRSKLELLPIIFHKCAIELRPLIYVRIWFSLNIILHVSSTGASGPSERKKKKEFPGRVEDIRLKMWLCVRDAVPSPLPLDEDNINAFRRLFEINNFKDSDQFSFYDVGNRTPNQMIAAVDNTLKYQIKHFCFIMFAGQMINGKKVDTANDLVCIFKLTSESQMTRQPPIILWRCEF